MKIIVFKEYLEDYKTREIEEFEKFLKELEDGKIFHDGRYPPINRFFKIDEKIFNGLHQKRIYF